MRPSTLALLAATVATAACGAAVVDVREPTHAAPLTGPGGSSDALSARLDRLAAELAPRGFSRLPGDGRGFLLEGDSASHAVELPAGTCVTVVAVGSVGVRDIDAQLWAAEGTVLSTDDEPDPHPIVQTCRDDEPTQAYFVIKMFAGAGAYRFAVLRSAREALPRAVALVRGDATRPPPTSSLDRQLATRTEEIEGRGFAARGEPAALTLGPAEVMRLPLPVERGGCYTMIAIGGDGLRELDMSVTDEDGVEVARDTTSGPEALTQLCTDTDEILSAEIRAAAGSGDMRFIVLGATSEVIGGPGRLWLGERRDRPGEVPVGRAVAMAEQQLRTEGATVRPTGPPVRLQQHAVYTTTVQARAGGCLALLAVGGRGLGRVRLSTFDAQGDPSSDPSVGVAWASTRLCPGRAGAVRVDVEALRGWGELAIVAGGEPPSPSARGARPVLAGRMQGLLADATAAGFAAVGAPITGRIVSGGLRQHPATSSARCARWVAAADGLDTDVRLFLLQRSGARLSADRTRRGAGWIELCDAPGLPANIEVRARTGGPEVEYRLVKLEKN